MQPETLGSFGNIFLRQHNLNKGESFAGHKHFYDHVTLLAQGKILVEIENHDPKEFIGPTFVVIHKDLEHHITALEDNTVYYCIFALRDVDGNVVENIYEEYHDPRSYGADLSKTNEETHEYANPDDEIVTMTRKELTKLLTVTEDGEDRRTVREIIKQKDELIKFYEEEKNRLADKVMEYMKMEGSFPPIKPTGILFDDDKNLIITLSNNTSINAGKLINVG